MPLLTIIGSISAVITFFIKLVKNYLLKYITHAIILSLQFTITASTIVFVLSFYAFVITAFVSLYNKSIDLVNYVLTSSDSTLSCFYGMLDCIGATDAINNGVTLFYASLGSIMIFHLFKFTWWALNAIKNEVFKLGLLLGQAVN